MDDKIVNVEYLAELFLCDVRTVQNYAEHNNLPRINRGEYPLNRCLIWYIEKQRKDIEILSKTDPEKLARNEAILLQNERRKLELSKVKESLLDREIVEQVNITAMKMINRNFKALAPRLTKKLNGGPETLSIVTAEVDETLTICANTSFNYFEEKINNQTESKEIN